MREYLQFYINGEWVDPITPKAHEVINPATEEVCAHISLGSEADVDRAVAAARKAFETWGYSSREERIAVLESCVATYEKYYNDMADARKWARPRLSPFQLRLMPGWATCRKRCVCCENSSSRKTWANTGCSRSLLVFAG